MRKRSLMLIISACLVGHVGCDSNPTGPTFPSVPPGTKIVPANTAPVVVEPEKAKVKAAPVEAG